MQIETRLWFSVRLQTDHSTPPRHRGLSPEPYRLDIIPLGEHTDLHHPPPLAS